MLRLMELSPFRNRHGPDQSGKFGPAPILGPMGRGSRTAAPKRPPTLIDTPTPFTGEGLGRGLRSYWACATLAGGVQITSLMVSCLGISFSSVKVSAIFCCAATTSGLMNCAP